MSYTKQTWTTGETITADKLNHMEDGIDGAGGSSSSGGFYIITGKVPVDGGDIGFIPSSNTLGSGIASALQAGQIPIVEATING